MGGTSGTHGGYQKEYRISVEKSGQPKLNERTRLENISYRHGMEGIDWVHGAQGKEK